MAIFIASDSDVIPNSGQEPVILTRITSYINCVSTMTVVFCIGLIPIKLSSLPVWGRLPGTDDHTRWREHFDKHVIKMNIITVEHSGSILVYYGTVCSAISQNNVLGGIRRSNNGELLLDGLLKIIINRAASKCSYEMLLHYFVGALKIVRPYPYSILTCSQVYFNFQIN